MLLESAQARGWWRLGPAWLRSSSLGLGIKGPAGGKERAMRRHFVGYRSMGVLGVTALLAACGATSPTVETGGVSSEAPAIVGAEASTDNSTLTSPDADPVGEEAERVREAVRAYVVENPGTAEGTFALPGEEAREASFEDFHTVHRRDAGYFVCVDFRDAEHLYDVDFVASGGDDVRVSSATVHKIDGEVVSD